jgi:acyl-coenzyme A synthetase/AMP-(fatty) acid ligase/acyl carrier protein
MVAWLERAEVELVHCVPSMLRLLLQTDDAGARLSRLAHVLVSGERLLPADVERWYEVMGTRPRLVNLYGPTETTMTKFFHVVTPDDRGSRSVPIGRPMPGAAAIVLDGCGCACPPGLIGEIFIWTPHRTRGYIGQPELTAQVFVPNPLTGDPNDVVYRTGDWGRMRPDGVFEFVGRRDGQVKIRGVRVEIGEIESALLREPGVAQAAVVIRDFDGEPAILAYVERAGGPDDLRVRLSQQLPDYMVPRRIVRLDRLPLLPNGKIDRAALPLPRLEAIPGRAPVTAMEQTVSALYAELLGRECVDADADFFELGGHSLAASRLVNRVRSTLSLDLPIRAVFDYPRVSDLAVALEGASRKLTSSLSS